ncbi:MAG: ROK family transcriptional regulator [Anaerolineae bacterium]
MAVLSDSLTPDFYCNSLPLPEHQYRVVEALLTIGLLSRTELAEHLGYSRALISGVVKELVDRAILTEGREADSTGGRRAKMLCLNSGFGYLIGIDMGATSLEIAVADFSGAHLLRRSEQIDVRDGPGVILDRLAVVVAEMLAELHIPADRVISVGIGVPGPVDFARGILIAPPIMPGWERYPIRERLRQTFPTATIVVDNDVNVMALGELRGGAGKDVENFIYVKIGTGIGCGIVVRGSIYRGSSGCAGDIGHIQADRQGPVCHCGNVGCLEAMASGSAIARRASEAAHDSSSPVLARYLADGAVLTAEHVGRAARSGDEVAMGIIKSSGMLIGEVLAGVVNFYNPSLIVIGGGVAKIGTQFLTTIRRGILSRSLPLSTQHLRIDYSSIGDDAGVIGAVALALEYVFIPEAAATKRTLVERRGH